ncbi:Tigger transposable element-derived protein 4 [Araneus ventricosus]|uniref:Tigger transposable element-derived protein 4 n=1 Tax=Araneus ventricosus TaxID=182803 RepID=A0A4Y2UH87_ARAVE|nr:Tigger transposable element-derived protein 4 [Araneus ventricosus]
MFKDDECRGRKQSKICLTMLLAAREDGTEKLLGGSEKPRCIAKVKSFLFKYKADTKAWMTSEIFGYWLKSLDISMRVKKRKNIALKNVSVKFFPENTTSKLQPIDQGLIRNYKFNYRRQLVRKLVDAIDEGSILPKINALDSVRMMDMEKCDTED